MRKLPLVLLAMGVAFAAAGLWVITMPTYINEGNQCGANGCMNVSANIPTVGPGIFLFIVGFIIAVYGLSRREGDEDPGPRTR
jgi:hypothetical protein